jgi:hypothetical protein
MKNRKAKNRLPPFLPLFNEMLDAPATKALSHGAFGLYAVLKRQFNTNVSDRWNGRIYLSQRRAQEEIGSNREEIARWYRELQYYGFIVMMTPGYLGLEGKGKAPRWRLTEVPCLGEPATKDFLSFFRNAARAREYALSLTFHRLAQDGRSQTGVGRDRAPRSRGLRKVCAPSRGIR